MVEVNTLGGAIFNEEENILRLLSESGMPRNLAKILLYLSKNKIESETGKKKKKKKKKNRIDSYLEDLEEEEIGEEDYIFYEILRYPPGSNPPTPNRNHSLHAEFTIIHNL